MITNETYLAVIDWVREPNTRRGITIDIDPCLDKEKIFCYDFNLQEGINVKEINEIPTEEDLKELKKQRLQEELDSL